MLRTAWLPGLSALLLIACTATQQSGRGATTPVSAPAGESAKLARIVDDYFEDYLKFNPILATSIGDPRYNDRYVVSIRPDVRAAEEQLERDYLARIGTVDRGRLSDADRITFDVFKSGREREIEGRYRDDLIPLNQFYSQANSFAQLGSGNGLQPFKTVKDYDDFLKRIDGFKEVDRPSTTCARACEGLQLPRVLAERVVPQLDAHIVARPEDSRTGARCGTCRRSFPPRIASG
jgi:uncharacterized protein (DUF885 family)